MDICAIYYRNANPEKAVPMASYMRNQFPFLGLTRPDRKEIDKEFLKSRKRDTVFDWDFVFSTAALPEREFFYLAIGYLSLNKNLIKYDDFQKIEELIQFKSWWDSVDSIAPIVGHLCMKFPDLIEEYILKWMVSDNVWMVRSSILFQLKYKDKTNLELLSKVIIENKESQEFFINKAIGWSLREYSKTDPQWVINFVNSYSLPSLSKREALRGINVHKCYSDEKRK